MSEPALRIDKWLWAVRLHKTRTLASEACRAGHVEIQGQRVKPARDVRVGEVITARVGVITKTVKVIALTDRRVGAKLVKDYLEDQTPAEEYAKLKELDRQSPVVQIQGWGRPTKKNRRTIDRLLSE